MASKTRFSKREIQCCLLRLAKELTSFYEVKLSQNRPEENPDFLNAQKEHKCMICQELLEHRLNNLLRVHEPCK